MHKLLLGSVLVMSGLQVAAAASKVEVKTDEAKQRVDVTIDGKPFTAYVWPNTLKKPVLFPLVAADGVTVTRGYPLAPRETERVDHPHHAGLWFNYGNANGFDFWNNSDAIKPEQRAKMGTIHHEKIVSARSGAKGELVTDSVWETGAGQKIFNQRTKYVFSQQGDARTIDMTVTLTALDKVVFHDDKEGVLGIRVAHFLESATEKGGMFADASGRPTKVEGNTAGATGVYLTSEGKQGDAVWSTRGKWCKLTGTTTDGHTETIAIFDRTGNPNYPTYWHARGYGLFAANPLGQKIFDAKQPQLDYTVEKGKSVTFRYRITISSHDVTADEMNKASNAFEAQVK
ncbi:MAG: PmoA family protein [Acidobacteria bacterium]|nr:PmoA family protein [Acidobacteriota bacterium]